ncbi:MAG: helix-turn-helix transcriptional regulator [Thermonemataceae bacterium]|nr:helix-turn-helix transcriptional regulator [Thermonemataceae bacterium]
MSQISKNIRYLRRLHDYTQEEFSELLGIKRSSLGAYEEGRATPNFTILMQLGKIFGVSLEQIVSGDLTQVLTAPVEKALFLVAQEQNGKTSKPLETSNLESDLLEENFSEKNTDIESKNDWRALEKEKIKPEEQNFRRKEKHQEVNEENLYPTIEEGLFSVDSHSESTNAVEKGDIPFVKQSNLLNYLANYNEKKFVEQLPKLKISLLPNHKEYRAFEMDKNFPMDKSISVGAYVKNWYQLQNNEVYLLLTQKQGLVYGKVQNKLRNEGYLLVTTFDIEHKVFLREVFEVWHFELFISAGTWEKL